MALEFLRLRRPYFGICLTQEHCDLLIAELEARVLMDMKNPDIPSLYSAAFADFLNKAEEADAEDAEEADGEEGTTKPKGRPKRKQLAKGEVPPPKKTKGAVLTKEQLLNQMAALQKQMGGKKPKGEKMKDDEDEEEDEEDEEDSKSG